MSNCLACLRGLRGSLGGRCSACRCGPGVNGKEEAQRLGREHNAFVHSEKKQHHPHVRRPGLRPARGRPGPGPVHHLPGWARLPAAGDAGEVRVGRRDGRGGKQTGGAHSLLSTLPLFPHFLSAFIWLAALFITSLILLPLSPLATLTSRIIALTVAVAVESATAFALWKADRSLLRSLAAVAADTPGHRPPDGGDAASLALAHGLAHGGTHAVLLYLAWLPVSGGGRTLYAPTCTGASLFSGGAIAAGAGVALHAGGALLAFAGWDDGEARLWQGAFGAHAAFAAVSLLNLVPGGGGCVVGLAGGVVVGVGTLVVAYRVEQRRAGEGKWRAAVAVSDGRDSRRSVAGETGTGE